MMIEPKQNKPSELSSQNPNLNLYNENIIMALWSVEVNPQCVMIITVSWRHMSIKSSKITDIFIVCSITWSADNKEKTPKVGIIGPLWEKSIDV